MRLTNRIVRTALLSATLLIPVSTATFSLQAADPQVYHDGRNNDDHHWDSHEDRAYRMYLKENHRKYVDFRRAKEEDRQSYWAWRHDHSDVVLKIK